jgi:hypothetical protein
MRNLHLNTCPAMSAPLGYRHVPLWANTAVNLAVGRVPAPVSCPLLTCRRVPPPIRAKRGLSRLRIACESPSPDSSVHYSYKHRHTHLPPLFSTLTRPPPLHIGILDHSIDPSQHLCPIYAAPPCPTHSLWPSRRRRWTTPWTSRRMHRTSTRQRPSQMSRTGRMGLTQRGKGRRAAVRKMKSHW